MPTRALPVFRLILVLALLLSGLTAAQPVHAQNCTDEAELVDTQLDPAAATFRPDEVLTVTWTLRNTGDCTWDRSYRLRFVDGDTLDGPRTARLRTRVEPGDTLDLTLDLTAPSDPGDYVGQWQLRSASGQDFGPLLTAEVTVEGDVAAAGEVILPEVLVFGGKGGGSAEDLYACLQEDEELPTEPTLIVDDSVAEYRYVSLFLCSLPEGAEVAVTVADPTGTTFRRSYVQDAAVTYGEGDQSYTGTVLYVPLSFLPASPAGVWTLEIAGDALTDSLTLDVPAWEPPPFEPNEFVKERYPILDNWPLTPIDPFAAAEGCHYTYGPEETLRVGGMFFPENTTLQIGVYQERLGEGYFISQTPVDVDDDGNFEVDLVSPATPGEYTLLAVATVNPEGYQDDGTVYEFGLTDDLSVWSCFSVALPEDPDALPWRLAFTSGLPGEADVIVLDMGNQAGYYPTRTFGSCDTAAPAFWPDGEWVVYQSNCVPVEGESMELTTGDDYDLYAHQIDFTYTLSEEEMLVRLTQTPDLDETEPAVDPDGRIVYRQAPAGSDLEAAGELWIVDVFEETTTPLDLVGRAPVWSPDGTQIAYMSDVEGSWQVYVYDLETAAVRRVSTNCTTHCRFPAWSPDGRQLIYSVAAASDDLTPAGLWIATVAGGLPRRWLAGAYDHPSWSEEGWIAFAGEGGIYRAQPRNPIPERYLYRNPELGTFDAPVWSR